MKRLLLLLTICSLVSCKRDFSKGPQLSWLQGKWQRVDDRDGRSTFENWRMQIDGSLLGHGFTLEENDTVFEEKLAIKPLNILVKNDNRWVLQVTGVNEFPTIFEIKEFTSKSFTAVNLENEFPTHIKYSIINDSLKAQVYSDQMSIDYTFKRR
ncbi:hypothetical protein JCM19275_2769 [Nonlabens ulvanivorans]|uniref:DUF6265 domain-containing protein n=1 Tax=Nonlabens ulvanivorans TaxID=906888 RepID=A0A090X1V1_NONUL|nr:DUF6265 family protein [Nonlabens ulvanivorans]GAL73922.1 hypothetical protein JCM19275_2769 [Nonlabens ulvanivorans]